MRGCGGQGVSTHSRPKAAAKLLYWRGYGCAVSTHSRPKAAAPCFTQWRNTSKCFNSQPPEGGCVLIEQTARTGIMFQLTAARRRLPVEVSIFTTVFTFQLTAARRRLPLALAKVIEQEGFNSQPPEGGCARENLGRVGNAAVSTHSRPKAAALTEGKAHVYGHVSTHSRPKAAAGELKITLDDFNVSTHSRPKAAARW